MPDEVTENEEAQEEAPRSKLKWIIVAAGAMLVLILGGIGAWAGGLFDMVLEETVVEAEEPPPQEQALDVNEVVTLDAVVVNLVPESRMSYARIGIALGLHNPSAPKPVLNESLIIPKVKDRLLTTVGEMNSDDLLKPETKEAIKKDLLKFVNKLVDNPEARVTEVYFTDFIIQ